MARRNITVGSPHRDDVFAVGPLGAVTILLVASSPVYLIALFVPPASILPVLCLVSLVNAAWIAALAWHVGARRGGSRLTVWDVAGLCLFLGLLAGGLSDPAHLLQLFGFAAVP